MQMWAMDVSRRRCEVITELCYETDEGLSDAEFASDLIGRIQASFTGIETVSVVLPRDRVNWQEFEVPAVPDGELPAIVQFQYATQVTGANDHTVVDFLSPKHRPAEGPIRVHAVGIGDRVVTMARSIADALGAELTSVGVSSVLLQELTSELQADNPDLQHVAAVVLGRHSVESVEIRNGDLVKSVARRHAGADAQRTFDAEVRRLQLGFDDDASSALYSFGKVDGSTSGELTAIDASRLPVTVADAVDTSWTDAGLLAAAGSALASLESQADQLNFAAPRQPIPPRDHTKDYIRAAIAAAVLLVVGVGWKTWSDSADLDERIDDTRTAMSNVDEFLDAKGNLREVKATIDEYLDSRMSVRGILKTVLESMPDRRRLIVTSIEPMQITGTMVARVKGRAYGQSLDDLEQFEAELDRHYKVKPQSKIPSEDRPGYHFVLDFEFDVPRQAKSASIKPKADRETPIRQTTVREKTDKETTNANA